MSKKSYSRLCILMITGLWIGLIVVPGGIGHADIGWPPVNPAGASVGPQDDFQTNVRMVSEEVHLNIEAFKRPVPEGESESPAYWMRGLVDASFVMRNLGETQETFDVWFPLAASTRYTEVLQYEMTPENIVQDFEVRVDDKQIKTAQVNAPSVGIPEYESSWAKFAMVFPPNQDVVIQVNYTIYPGGRRPFGDFEYILQTGAGWKDSIGEATIVIQLPYNVTTEAVSFSGNDVYGYPLAPQPEGFIVEKNTLTWHFTGLEPATKDNIFINVLEPERYQRLVQARAQVLTTPNSADAQLELARALSESVLIIKSVAKNGGGKALAQAANAAYDKALVLSPERADIYGDYANWLMRSGSGWQLFTGGTCPEILCKLVKKGLEKFPNDPELNKINEIIRSYQEDAAFNATEQAKYTDTQVVTKSPTPVPTKTPPVATRTSPPTVTTSPQVIQPTKTPPVATLTPSPTITPRSQAMIQPSITVALSPTALPDTGKKDNNGLVPASLLILAVLAGVLGFVFYRRSRKG